jgi:RHS repeat-associated protein
MAVDGSGYVVKYSGTSWSAPSDIDGSSQIEAVSCATTSFCLAVDSSGDYLKYNGTSWTSRASYDTFDVPESVSCPSSNFCMTVGSEGRAYSFNGSIWTPYKKADGTTQINGVSCTSATFCMAIDISGNAVKFNGSTWTQTTGVLPLWGTSVSCTSTTFCVAVDFYGREATYTGSWAAESSIDPSHWLASVSCTSSTLCRAVDTVGNVLTYNGSTWTSSDIDGATPLESVSCVSAAFCQAVDHAGHAVSYQQVAMTTPFAWDVVTGGSLPRLIADGTNAYIYGPNLFGESAPLEQISLTTHAITYLSSIPSGVQLAFSSTGSLVNRSSYSTYGVQSNTSSSGAATPFGFKGGYTDPSGLVYLINRYYDPVTGQFISVDPDLNLTDQPYAFAGDDPINASDSLGLCSDRDQACVTAAFAAWIINGDTQMIKNGHQLSSAEFWGLANAKNWVANDYSPSVQANPDLKSNVLGSALVAFGELFGGGSLVDFGTYGLAALDAAITAGEIAGTLATIATFATAGLVVVVLVGGVLVVLGALAFLSIL